MLYDVVMIAYDMCIHFDSRNIRSREKAFFNRLLIVKKGKRRLTMNRRLALLSYDGHSYSSATQRFFISRYLE